ncbi:MAG TPA: adenylate/guanylate cyclase domain-containing protein [Casimicrobiaceae bacterium]|nr:adenylate/guanylate cyclase domain-containing protein [Casimicrobiaceae bacterium]
MRIDLRRLRARLAGAPRRLARLVAEAPRWLVKAVVEAPRWLVALSLVIAFCLEALLLPPDARLLSKLEAIAYDARLALTQTGTTDPQIVIVDIDESSLAREGRFPWPRDKLARLTRLLLERHHARAVGFDVLFPERDTGNGLTVLEDLAQGELSRDDGFVRTLPELRRRLDFDGQFAALLAGRPVVLAYSFTGRAQRVGVLGAPVFTQAQLGHPLPIQAEAGYTGNLAPLQQAAAASGHIDPLFDSDRTIRRAPLIKRFGDGYYPALAVALAQVAVEAKSVKPLIDAQGDLEALDIGGLQVPVDRFGNALIPYRGPQGTFRYFSAGDVLAERVAPDAFAGAIVLIGTSAKGLLDLRATPMGPDYPGVEIHANLLSGMLNGELRSIPPGAREAEALIMLVAGLITVFVVPWRRPLLCLLGTFAVALAVLALNLWLWDRQSAVLPIATTLAMLLALLFYNLSTGFVRESRAIRQLSDMFGEYIPRERVAAMRESGERFTMESESRELTVLFSDVRDFTAISEGLSPRELAKLMNAYLSAQTEVIHDTRGTIDKYIGDAIMAFWGAPLANPRHARDAVMAALGMQRRVAHLNDDWRKRGWPRFDIGVGINTGTMSVGDMGSRFRKAYTVLGDAVNLASRLEGLTKVYGVGILIGEDTRAAVPDILCREIDRVRVKGRSAPLTIYEPLGVSIDAVAQQRLARWNEALGLFRERRFAAAQKMFAELREGGDAALCAVFEARCATYAQVLLPADWDGAETFTTK